MTHLNKSLCYACIGLGISLVQSCSDNDKLSTGTPPATGTTYTPLPEYVVSQNQNNLGMGEADSENIYYWAAVSSTEVALCAQNKETGKVTLLDNIKSPEGGGDFMFTNLHARDGYLYYQPFDIPGDRRYYLYAVKTDGTEKPKAIAQNALVPAYGNNAIYYTDGLDTKNVFSLDYVTDGSAEPQKLFTHPGDAATMSYLDGHFYFRDYEGSGSDFHAVHYRMDMEGNTQQIYEYDTYGLAQTGRDNMLIFDTDPQNGTYLLNSVPYTGGEYQTILTGLPSATSVIEYEGTLFIGISGEYGEWENGLYSINLDTGERKQLVKDIPVTYVIIISDSQLIIGNGNEIVSRLATPYIVDFDGSNLRKLTI